MAYITKAEYDVFFPGNEITDADFTIIEDIASNIINRATIGKINAFGLTSLTTTLQDKIKKATAHQVNVLEKNGALDALIGDSELDSASITIGSYSESFSGQGNFRGSRTKMVDGIPISPVPNIILHGTGLLDTACKITNLERLNELNP